LVTHVIDRVRSIIGKNVHKWFELMR